MRLSEFGLAGMQKVEVLERAKGIIDTLKSQGDHLRVPARPDLFANELSGHFVVGAFDFDVAVAVDRA